jgi:hypothetical protein
MAAELPTLAQLFQSLISKGYAIEIYLQKNEKYAIVVTKKGEPRRGVSMDSMTTRMVTAALIKIRRKIEELNGTNE